jgi:apolipoprotein D and lipocalin family protein
MIPAARQMTGLLAALLLAACAAAPAKVQGFRAKGPIYSNAVMDMAQVAGRWTQAATFASGGKPGCAAGGAEISSTPTGLTIATRLCLNGAEVSYAGPLAVTGPGRATPTGAARAPLDREWWVLWADVDLRTLVIGTPDGSFGFILNRGGPLPQDRLKAAREILDWNGYDTARLMTFR